MKEIELSKQGKNKGKYVALVDDEDYDWLNKYRWSALVKKNTIYATRMPPKENAKMIFMHREIMAVSGSNIFIDHIDHHGLNNQKVNLRTATCAQNAANRTCRKGGTSSYLGVNLQTIKRLRENETGVEVQCEYTYWRATIRKDKKQIPLGSFDNEIAAAIAYDKAAKEIHGEFANLNFK